jgi:hypothetical protein
MKLPRKLPAGPAVTLLCVFLLALGLAGCRSDGTSTAGGERTSMKGWELYSWQEGGEWCFSLLVGTNRDKSIDEIQSTSNLLEGIDGLRPALESLAAGQYVIWWSPSWTEGAVAFPPDDVLQQVQSLCEDLELQLTVATQSP